MRYTQKQIDKYHRQKYIAELEKIAKNLFRMFRDVHMDAQSMIAKLDQLKKNWMKKQRCSSILNIIASLKYIYKKFMSKSVYQKNLMMYSLTR